MGDPLDACFDWDLQKADFQADGSLRDLYVLGTTVADWAQILEFLQEPPYEARLTRAEVQGSPVPRPTELTALFDQPTRYLLEFTVSGVLLLSHFFSKEDVEFDFLPNGLSENQMHGLLLFMAHLGDLVGKPVVMTPENARHLPIYEYQPSTRRMRWIASTG